MLLRGVTSAINTGIKIPGDVQASPVNNIPTTIYLFYHFKSRFTRKNTSNSFDIGVSSHSIVGDEKDGNLWLGFACCAAGVPSATRDDSSVQQGFPQGPC